MKKTLLIASALLMSSSLFAQEQTYEPVEIVSGFNMDIICEDNSSTAAVGATTTQIPMKECQGIDGSGFVFYTKNVQESGAMCAEDGIFTTTARGIKYKVYTSKTGILNNALVMKKGKLIYDGGANDGTGTAPDTDEGTLVFKTPVKGKSIYVVGTSADGTSTLKVTINYKDGTTIDDQITVGDWGSGTGAVLSGLGRMASKNPGWGGYTPGKYDSGAGNVFRLFESAVNTNPEKEISSVTLKRTNSGTCCAVFAVSISNDVVQEVNAIETVSRQATQVSDIHLLNGQRVNTLQRGVNIVRYQDNSVRKIMVK